MALASRDWVAKHCEERVQSIARQTRKSVSGQIAERLEILAARNREIHERDCFNLNPATNLMNPAPRR